MCIDRVLLFGAGGHAAVVLDALLLDKSPKDIVVVDDKIAHAGSNLMGIAVFRPEEVASLACHFHVGIGDNRVRAKIFARLAKDGRRAVTVKHPSAVISNAADISNGCFVAAQSVVAPRARLGQSTIVNHGAIIDHDCLVGNFCHIAPAATLGGNVMIGDFVLVGAGATILPGVQIGEGASIGAGAVVVRNIEPGAVVAGVPAVSIKRS